MALGAQATEVVAWVMRRGLVATLAGLGGGAAAAWYSARTLTGFLYGVGPADPLTFVAALAFLAIVAGAANFFPARRSARIDPVIALRVE